MQNPTFDQIINKSYADVSSAWSILGLAHDQDARLSIQRLLMRLVERHKLMIAAGQNPRTYSVDLSLENIDINTQRQVFTIIFDMRLDAVATDNESLILP